MMIRRNLLGRSRSQSKSMGAAEGQGESPSEESHSAEGMPQLIDEGPTGRYYHFPHVLPCYRRESVTSGGDSGRGGDPRRGKEEEAVMCQLDVAVRCKPI